MRNPHSFWFVVLLVWLASAVNAHAAITLMGDLSHEYTVTGGQQISGTLEIGNTSKTTAEVKLYQEDNAPPNGANSGHGRSNRSWVRLSTDHITLPPNGRQKVAYTVSVPAGVAAGSQWSMINIEPIRADSREAQVPNNQGGDGTLTVMINQKVRYAVAIITHSGNGAANLSFTAPQIARNAEGKRMLDTTLRNSGNRFARPAVTLEVFDVNGNPVASLKGSSVGMLPGMVKPVSVDVSSLKPGTYKSLLAAEDKTSGKSFGVDVGLTIQP